MNFQIDFALMILSGVLFGLVSGTYAALELFSYGPLEKNGDAGDSRIDFVDKLLEKPVPNYLALGLGTLLLLGALITTTTRFAIHYLFAGEVNSVGLFFFVLGVILVPLSVSRLLALRTPRQFIELAKVITYPVIYLLRPIVFAATLLLRRMSPALIDTLSFPILPFKRRIEIFGHGSDEDTDEQNLMSSVFDFADTKVREVMVPRIDMVAVNVHTNVTEAVEVIVDAGHSRIPIYDDSIDKVVGIVHTKDLTKKLVAGDEFLLKDVTRDVYFVPESKMIDELLSEFKKRKIHIAVVVDEYGGTAGLITLEDILEELVGEIQDEFDSEEELIERVDEDRVVCNGRIRLDDLNEALALDLPVGDVDTLGGFLYESIGHVPLVGESIMHGDLQFRVESVVGQRIDKVLIKGLSSFPRRMEDSVG